MDLERTFEAAASTVVCEQRVQGFLARAGYWRVSDSELKFSRGSTLGSYTSFSVRKWKASVSVKIQPRDENRAAVSLAVEVNTTGQLLTQRETDYWESEVNEFQRAIQTGEMDVGDLVKSNEALAGSGWKGVWLFISVGISVGIAVGILAALVHPWLGGIGVAAGISAGRAAARKHWGW